MARKRGVKAKEKMKNSVRHNQPKLLASIHYCSIPAIVSETDVFSRRDGGIKYPPIYRSHLIIKAQNLDGEGRKTTVRLMYQTQKK